MLGTVTAGSGPTHCFSIDLEGFAESHAESGVVAVDESYGRREKAEIEANTEWILEFLDGYGVKCTFFTLGVIAERQPGIVRQIAAAGHELGSHSYRHERLYGMPAQEARDAIVRSKKAIEDVSGLPVLGFRAPAFSISLPTLYLLDFILDAGYQYDSSIFPIPWHDLYGYGIPTAQRGIHRHPNGLIEFPPSTVRLGGRNLPGLGGAYFRLFPFAYSSFVLRRIERERGPGLGTAMFYAHPYEIGPECPRIEGMSAFHRLLYYGNITKSKKHLDRLFRHRSFQGARAILIEQGFLAA